MRFCDFIGYGLSVETPPDSGVYVDVIEERKLIGDVIRNTRQRPENGERLNNDLAVSNSISVVADAYANQHVFDIRYVKWMGTRWTVTDVEIQSPRLVLKLGVVYNGPLPA